MYTKLLYLFVLPLASGYSILEKIMNGTAVTNDYLYQVSIQVKTFEASTDRGHICGGVLVTETHVLTIATCVARRNASGLVETVEPELFRVQAGSTDLQNETAAANIAKILIHESFNYNTAVNNLAILVLSSKFKLTVHAITLNDSDIHSNCEVSGWGRNSQTSTDLSRYLMSISVTIEDQAICQAKYQAAGYPEGLLNTTLCIQGMPNAASGIAEGDLGSPLVCSSYLQGLALTREDVFNLTGVFVRIPPYNSWIKTTIANNPFVSSGNSISASSVVLFIMIANLIRLL